MITRRTVFVLGAGASYPYGLPTGEELVDEIVALPRRTSSPERVGEESDGALEVLRKLPVI